jgi:hypothetical protein
MEVKSLILPFDESSPGAILSSEKQQGQVHSDLLGPEIDLETSAGVGKAMILG